MSWCVIFAQLLRLGFSRRFDGWLSKNPNRWLRLKFAGLNPSKISIERVGTDTALIPFVREDRANTGIGQRIVFADQLGTAPSLKATKIRRFRFVLGTIVSILWGVIKSPELGASTGLSIRTRYMRCSIKGTLGASQSSIIPAHHKGLRP